MGRSRTPAYRVEFKTNGTKVVTGSTWDVGGKFGKGKPTHANLKKYVDALNASFEPGGLNEHCGAESKIIGAFLIRQSSGEVVASYGVTA